MADGSSQVLPTADSDESRDMSSYHFGSFILDVRERRVLRDECPISLTPKVFDTLVYLVEHHGHLVGKDELLEAIWGGSSVEEGSLPRAIHVLRKALTPGDGDNELHRQFIETVPTKGYRFAADVTCVDGHSSLANLPVAGAAQSARPDIRREQPRGDARSLRRLAC
jgi:DNA-binding winged helix-turn-helix (wHTH) protein